MTVEELKARFKKFAIHVAEIVEEELDESIFFLEMLEHFNPDRAEQIKSLQKEGQQLLAITVSSIKTSRAQS